MKRERPSIPFLLDLLSLAVRKEAVAVYIVPWLPPTLRLDERTVPLSSATFTPEQSRALVLDLLDDAQRAALDRSREIQFSLLLSGVGRFRVHAFRRHGQPAMALRPFALQVPTPKTLALPALACDVALADRGLVLVASRSSSLQRDAIAALLEHRNRAGSGDIVLLDDATRCWHESARCSVHQGLNAAQADALALRRSGAPGEPGLAIAWGEVRDPPTLARAARCAANALCLVTLPAHSLLHCLQRAAAMAVAEGHADSLTRMAMALHAAISLRPVAAADGGRDLAATEVLLNSPEVAACLAEQDFGALHAALANGGARGVLGPDEHLWALVVQGLVRFEDALRQAAQPAAFALRAELGAPGAQSGAAAAPVTVDTAFADLFTSSAPAPDPFDFADSPPAAQRSETHFDSFDWSKPGALVETDLQAPERLARGVQFRAYAPATIAHGSSAQVDIWAALPTQEARLARLAGAEHPDPEEPDATLLADTDVITLQLRVDGLAPATPGQQIVWQGQPDRARFVVAVPPGALVGAHAARVRLSVNGLPIGELSFLLHVAVRAAETRPHDTHAARRMLQHAYAAYAVEDRAEVLAAVRSLQRVAPDFEVCLDAPALRSGEQWRERIEREVGRRERLLLFWSRPAAESPWVDYEWRLMARNRGLGAIDVLLLDKRSAAQLPRELAELPLSVVRVPTTTAAPRPA